ncbi:MULTISPECIES: formate--tetrahydrofolate ligase [unclassified Corynebacterium]|uniref:formate--tetrahydrofolate ligase n=1 Tax=unclassified Corynebacterium TaxID=2624378 RepID=UPI00298E3F63|nr:MULTISPECIES: formate--tetrahydrofolate ligase [unclassified Corynebacterium]
MALGILGTVSAPEQKPSNPSSSDHTEASAHTSSQPSDVCIAQAHQLEPIADVARRAGIPEETTVPYGTTKAKVTVGKLAQSATKGKVVLVTGMSPTPAGEGKSTVLIGLVDGLASAGVKTMAALREPSLGPVLGMKGGAAGGGYSQVVPMEDINLHFTGDLHAITSANNALAALIDNHVQQGNSLNLDPRKIVWRRCLDVNDRVLRNIITGLGGKGGGVPREAGFDITAASEVMAVLCLARDLADLRERLGRMLIGYTRDNDPVFVHDLGVEGSLVALLRDAMSPNLVQTLGGAPALIHGGPFANIAHGCNSVIATNTARELADVVVTEAGFGADLGAEKFTDIASVAGDFAADVAVIVVTARSLKYNGGVARGDLNEENVEAVRSGLANVERHCASLRRLGMQPIVAVNKFITDTDAELSAIKEWADDHGLRAAVADVWGEGGAGAADLVTQVREALADEPVRTDTGQSGAAETRFYDPQQGVKASITTIAHDIYGAEQVEYSQQAGKDLAQLKRHGWDTLPVCISKTPYSFSDDPSLLGAPKNHTLHVQRLIPKLGPGFVVALTGTVFTMPGLPKHPAAMEIDVTDDGTITGLF